MDTNDSTIGPTQTTPAIDKGNKGEKDEIDFQRTLFTNQQDDDFLKNTFPPPPQFAIYINILTY